MSVRIKTVEVKHAFAGVAVSEFAAAYDWYVSIFGRAADMFPHDGEAVWRLTPCSSVFVVADPERAGNGRVTLALDDLNACEKRLRADGLALSEEAQGEAPRRLVLTDVDGNTITLFQNPEPREG